MAGLKHVISLIIAIIAFFYTFFAVGKLAIFLSEPRAAQPGHTWIINLLDNKSKLETAFPAILYDMILIIMFILQHSLMKSIIVSKILQKLGLGLAERAIYCLTSAACLYYLIINWQYAPTLVLWQFGAEKGSALWWTLVVIHVFAWSVIYGGSLIMDLPEIIGIKQVYYDMKAYAPPIAYKSFELRHLYSNVRHPSFVGFTTILWTTNMMSVDRLILSVMLTLYMYVAWSTDYNDVIYHKCQLYRKREELDRAIR